MAAEAKPLPKPSLQKDDRRAIYEQDGEFVRHFESAMWRRFQLAALIEGAALYVLIFEGTGLWQTVGVLGSATIAIGLTFSFAVDDYKASNRHIERMGEFEKAHGVQLPPVTSYWPYRITTAWVTMMVVLVFNVVASINVARQAMGL